MKWLICQEWNKELELNNLGNFQIRKGVFRIQQLGEFPDTQRCVEEIENRSWNVHSQLL